jgi:surfactin synthase thioesterase subunit
MAMKTRLYVFPFAGGSSYAFRPFSLALTPHLSVRVLDYPGHGKRFKEPLPGTTQEMADDVMARIRAEIAEGGGYALFGHSMGAQVAFLTARRIMAERLPPPTRLFLSARRAPSCLEKSRLWSTFSDAELVGTIRDLGGTNHAVLECPELLELFMPVLRADIRALEKGDPESPGGLDVPLSIYRGLDDDVDREDADRWRLESRGAFERLDFAGGHFFVLERAPEVGACVRRRLAADESERFGLGSAGS